MDIRDELMKEPGFGDAKVFIKAPTEPVYCIVLVVQKKNELRALQAPPCLNEFDAAYRTDFPKIGFVDKDQSYIQGSDSMHDKVLLRRWKADANIEDGALRKVIQENRFILYKYSLNPANFDTIRIRLQGYPKATAHYLARPADAMSMKTWTKIFNDGMDQRGAPFEIPSNELDKLISENKLSTPPKDAVERVLGAWALN